MFYLKYKIYTTFFLAFSPYVSFIDNVMNVNHLKKYINVYENN